MPTKMSFIAAVLVAVASCSTGAGADSTSSPASATGEHSHDHSNGDGHVSLPVGDGTTASEVGYTLRDVRLPREAGRPGRLRFVVQDFRGRPHTRFLTEQTKKMHVYVVRDDYAVFRHVHPEMRPDGTWVGSLTLPEAGDYRVVAEFVARDDGGNGDHLVLGERVRVPGSWEAEPSAVVAAPTASDWGLEAGVVGELSAGREDELRVRLTSAGGGAPRVGQFLGTSAHLTGFHQESGVVVHMHPLGSPEVAQDAAELVFHAEFPEPGDYVLFLQVPVDDFVHTLPLLVTAS